MWYGIEELYKNTALTRCSWYIVTFLAAATSSPADKLHWVFQMYDKDNSNSIQVLSLAMVTCTWSAERDGGTVRHSLPLRRPGPGSCRGEGHKGKPGACLLSWLFQIFSTLDIDNDGDVTEEEFVRGCLQVTTIAQHSMSSVYTSVNCLPKRMLRI